MAYKITTYVIRLANDTVILCNNKWLNKKTIFKEIDRRRWIWPTMANWISVPPLSVWATSQEVMHSKVYYLLSSNSSFFTPLNYT